jgi:hypothetical protein
LGGPTGDTGYIHDLSSGFTPYRLITAEKKNTLSQPYARLAADVAFEQNFGRVFRGGR